MQRYVARETRFYATLSAPLTNFTILPAGTLVWREFGTEIYSNESYAVLSIRGEDGNLTVGYVKDCDLKLDLNTDCVLAVRPCTLWADMAKTRAIAEIPRGTRLRVRDRKTGNPEFILVDLPLSLSLSCEVEEGEAEVEVAGETDSECQTRTRTGYVECLYASKDRDTSSSFYRESGVRIRDYPLYDFHFTSIAIFRSCFPDRNGCPRQGVVCRKSRGVVEMTLKTSSCLDGLEDFGRVWLLFAFHENKLSSQRRLMPKKVRPPRLGKRLGIFACRTPHRVNPIGMTCAKIDRIEPNRLFVSGIDLIDQTPILDIKPYVIYSDSFSDSAEPDWVQTRLATTISDVRFSPEVLEALEEPGFCSNLRYFDSVSDLKDAVVEIVKNDPRPRYMRARREEKLYGFRLDCLNFRCLFGDDDSVEVVEVAVWKDEDEQS